MNFKKVAALLSASVMLLSLTACGGGSNKVALEGITKAKDFKNISLGFSSEVKDVYVMNGQHIKNGEAIFSIDYSNYKSDIEIAEQQVKIDEIALEKAINDRDAMKNELTRMQAKLAKDTKALNNKSDLEYRKLMNDLSYSKRNLESAKKSLAEQIALYKSGAISYNEFAVQQKNVEDAEKKVFDVTYSADVLFQTKKEALIDLEVACSKIETSIVNLDKDIEDKTERIKLSNCKITALKEKLNKDYLENDKVVYKGNDGVVFDISASKGDILTGSEKIASIADTSGIYVEAYVYEEMLSKIQIGAKAHITLQNNKKQSYDGKVVSISGKPTLHYDETAVPIVIQIDSSDEALLPNFGVDVVVENL